MMFDEKSVRRKLGFSISEEEEEGFIRTRLGTIVKPSKSEQEILVKVIFFRLIRLKFVWIFQFKNQRYDFLLNFFCCNIIIFDVPI